MPIPSSALDCHCIETTQPATAAIIWLHGLGATAHDFDVIIPHLKTNPNLAACRFIFPQAPSRPVTLNQGYIMPAWYDIIALDRMGPQDAQGIAQSAQSIDQMIEAQIQSGIDPKRIFLIGFSQGGAMVLHTSLYQKNVLGGVVALSCYLPLAQTTAAQADQLNTQTPIWMASGRQDLVVSFAYGEESAQLLQSFGCSVSFNAYAMAHELCLPEIDDFANWIVARMQSDAIEDMQS